MIKTEFKVGDKIRAKIGTKEGKQYNGITFEKMFLRIPIIEFVDESTVRLINGYWIGKDAVEVIPEEELVVTFRGVPQPIDMFDLFVEEKPINLFGGFGQLAYDKPKRKEKTTMQKLTTLAKKLLDPETKALMEVGWLDSELDLTEAGEKAILIWLLEQNKAALAKEAKDLLAEEKKARKGE